MIFCFVSILRKTKNKMNPLFLIAAAAGTVYLVHALRTVKAAKNLDYQLKGVQIYRLKLTRPIVFRVWVNFTNLTSAPITIKQIFLNFFLNFGTAENPDFQRVGTLNTDNKELTIPGNRTVNKSFDIEVPWLNLGAVAVSMFQGYLTGQGLKLPNTCKVEGQIKALGFSIPVNYEIPFSATPIEN